MAFDLASKFLSSIIQDNKYEPLRRVNCCRLFSTKCGQCPCNKLVGENYNYEKYDKISLAYDSLDHSTSLKQLLVVGL